MFTIDTNILIYYAAGDKNIAAFFLSREDAVFYLPSIVATEFLSYPLIDAHTIVLFRAFARQTTVIALDLYIAELAADIRRNYRLKLADAVIAATALTTQSTLVTRNISDFKKIPHLLLQKI